MWVAHIADARVAHIEHDAFGRAIRAVVHDEYVYLNIALVENALDGASDGVRALIGRHDNGDINQFEAPNRAKEMAIQVLCAIAQCMGIIPEMGG